MASRIFFTLPNISMLFDSSFRPNDSILNGKNRAAAVATCCVGILGCTSCGRTQKCHEGIAVASGTPLTDRVHALAAKKKRHHVDNKPDECFHALTPLWQGARSHPQKKRRGSLRRRQPLTKSGLSPRNCPLRDASSQKGWKPCTRRITHGSLPLKILLFGGVPEPANDAVSSCAQVRMPDATRLQRSPEK